MKALEMSSYNIYAYDLEAKPTQFTVWCY